MGEFCIVKSHNKKYSENELLRYDADTISHTDIQTYKVPVHTSLSLSIQILSITR